VYSALCEPSFNAIATGGNPRIKQAPRGDRVKRGSMREPLMRPWPLNSREGPAPDRELVLGLGIVARPPYARYFERLGRDIKARACSSLGNVSFSGSHSSFRPSIKAMLHK